MSVNGRGLETIKKYMPSFKLKEDMLNFRVNALLDLEGVENLEKYSQAVIL